MKTYQELMDYFKELGVPEDKIDEAIIYYVDCEFNVHPTLRPTLRKDD